MKGKENFVLFHHSGASQWGIKVKLAKAVQYEFSSEDPNEVEKQIIKWETNAHADIHCEACNEMPIRGKRFMCTKCPNYNLCYSCCLENQKHDHHVFLVIPSGKTGQKLKNHLHGPACKCHL